MVIILVVYVSHEVPSYFNIFKCGRDLLNRLDMKYERACMATPKDKYFEKMFETLVDYNDHHNGPFSNEKLQQSVSKFMAETEEGKRNIISDANNMAMDTFCQSPVTTNTQRKNANIPNEMQITLYILVQTLKGLTLHSTINDYAYYISDEDDTESNLKRDPLVDTHTSDGKKKTSLILTLPT